jgi:transcriptional pleiotropic regulator of transition state genes
MVSAPQRRSSEKGAHSMKSTGIVRKVDELGRIVLPIEMRRTLDIAEKDALEIYVEGSSVILKKYKPSCIFCDSTKDITLLQGEERLSEMPQGAQEP